MESMCVVCISSEWLWNYHILLFQGIDYVYHIYFVEDSKICGKMDFTEMLYFYMGF